MMCLIFFTACPSFIYPERKYPVGLFPDSICNLSEVNSPYDDINMDLMQVFCNNYLVFSSNRNTNGNTYDLIYSQISFAWDQVDGEFFVSQEAYGIDAFLKKMAWASQTDGNEFGPLFFSMQVNPQQGYSYEKYYLFYSDDKDGSQDVRFFEFDRKYDSQLTATFADSLKKEKKTVAFLSNPGFNEGYISFMSNEYPPSRPEANKYYDNTSFEKIIYCSDSLGQYDIYSIDISKNTELDSFLLQKNHIEKVNLQTLNSEWNDRCPNVNRNFIVFSSDRPGGLGGFDFYYSIYENGQWSQPVNFGSPINSPYDEFRAVAVKASGFENDLLLFSSNRPGGKGGFDIFYTGIKMMPE
jgi:hypothetical protein